jgi:DNA-binding MarR family transcriptional regulator
MNTIDRHIVDDERVDFGELTESLGFLLRLAQIRSFEAFYRHLSGFDIRPGAHTVLWVVGLNPGMRQGVIARKLNIKPAHMTKLVQDLVDRKLVSRTVPDDDRRAVCLSLTKEGQAFIQENKADFMAYRKIERGNLSDRESAELGRLLRKFTGLGQGT